MSGLRIDCTGVRPDRYAVAPTLLFELRLRQDADQPIQAITLHTQIRLEPARRSYTRQEEAGLLDLFGERWRWGDTLKPLQFAAASVHVPSFRDEVTVELPVPCTYDIEVVTAKYLHALADGVVPLLLLFSGSVFRRAATGMSVEPVPWDLETECRMPVSAWHQLVALHYPHTGYLRLGTETLAALQRFKSGQALASWDEALLLLLDKSGQAAP